VRYCKGTIWRSPIFETFASATFDQKLADCAAIKNGKKNAKTISVIFLFIGSIGLFVNNLNHFFNSLQI
jgi:hypothetical protein